MRKFILATFLVTSLGAGFELFLLEHMEDFWQIVPLVLIGISAVMILWMHVGAPDLVEKIFTALMLLSIISGFVGVFLHLKGNIEFEQEMYPAMEGFELMWKSLKGATPSLAPGTMMAIGMIGMLYTRSKPITETDN